MDQVITLETQGEVLEINSPQKKFGSVSLLLTLLILLSVISGLSFGVGFLFGKITANEAITENSRKDATIVDQKNGYSLFSDTFAKFQVTYPSSWKAESRKTGPTGAIFQSKDSSVEFWLVVDQPLALSSEQKAGVDKTNKIELKINSQSTGATEYVYKGGNFLTNGSLAASDTKPKVTFLIKADDQKNYDLAKILVQSFTLVN